MPSRVTPVFAAAATLAWGATITPAQASSPGRPAPGPPSGWVVGVGGGAIASPDYRGSSTYRLRPIPVVSVRYGDDFALSGLEASYTVMRAGAWRAGPHARFRFGQDEEDNRVALRGLGDVGPAVELGGFVSYGPGPLKLKASLTHDVANGHGGQVATLGAAYTAQVRRTPAGPVLLSIGPSLTWASGRFNRAYFGVDGRQSARSGLAPYRPRSGLESAGLAMNLVAPISARVTFVAIASYDRLTGDAANSPRVRGLGSRDQAMVGAFATYRLF